jgi:hypothetical protein
MTQHFYFGKKARHDALILRYLDGAVLELQRYQFPVGHDPALSG